MSALIDITLTKLADRLARELTRLGWSIATAESCTGGWIAHVLTAVPSSSCWFERGFVTYSDEAKSYMLDIDINLIKKKGPVCEEIALAMAQGSLIHSKAQVSLAITGLAGPGTDHESKVSVGTCWFAWSLNKQLTSQRQYFEGDRTRVNYQAVQYSLSELISLLKTLR